MQSGDTQRRRRRIRRWLIAPLATLLTILIALLLVINITPRPGAALIKYVFEKDGGDKRDAMAVYAPDGISVVSNLQYRPGDDDAYLDVYYADGTTGPQPLLVWTHGGAWISGHKDDDAPYFEIVASHGYTVISLQYSLGPGAKYPTAIKQVNDALAYIVQNAAQLHVDPARIMMAGDSAGAQITSQYAAIVTNPDFAAEVGVTPSLRPEQLRGVVLYCGIYDLQTFMKKGGVVRGLTGLILNWGDHTAIWAYAGTKDPDSWQLAQMSTLKHVTAAYPPVFISGGNGDPLTDGQSVPLANALQGLGVPVTGLFYDEDHEPSLEHEYQFQLDLADAQTALTEMLAFLDQHAK